MPWGITIRRGDCLPLGSQDEVKSGIATALPGVRFYREPDGMEKITALKVLGVELPDILKRHLEESQATDQGDFEGDGYVIRFYLNTGGQTTVDADVWGDSERAYPLLRKLADANRWTVAERGNPIPFIE